MKTTEISSYEQQAIDFATKNNVKLIINSSRYGLMPNWNDKQMRYIFNLTLKVDKKQYTFEFGQSIQAGNKAPNMYDVLTCLTKYEPGTFENFCRDFGYDNDSIKAEKTYKAVCKEYAAMERLFTSEQLEEMSEIQ